MPDPVSHAAVRPHVDPGFLEPGKPFRRIAREVVDRAALASSVRDSGLRDAERRTEKLDKLVLRHSGLHLCEALAGEAGGLLHEPVEGVRDKEQVSKKSELQQDIECPGCFLHVPILPQREADSHHDSSGESSQSSSSSNS